jgi:Pentapeptide repeats (9 copies)
LVSTCSYEYHEWGHNFNAAAAARCVYLDVNYLKGDNYGRNKEEVSSRFNHKLSKYSSNNMPLEFIGYYLPEVSFDYYEFASPLYFSDATFYGPVSFRNAKLYYEVRFISTKFFKEVNFGGATLSRLTSFGLAMFYESAYF